MVDPLLTRSLERLTERFASDPRCLGMYLWGSLGSGEADAHSDVDAAVVVRDEDYEALAGELRGAVEQECGPVTAWLTEGEAAGFCNFAFLYEAGGRVLLYDLTLLSLSAFRERRPAVGRVLISREGLFAEPPRGHPAAPPRKAPVGRLGWLITNYWVYMYLNGKYWRRRDLYKLLYVQQVLFQTHLKVLNTLQPEAEWTWWARDVQHLSRETGEALLAYFPGAAPAAVREALGRECDLFSRDAAAACRRHGLPYPEAMEAAVRRHLEDSGALGLARSHCTG